MADAVWALFVCGVSWSFPTGTPTQDAGDAMICQAGKCCVCEKDIAETCPTCGSKRFNEQHNQVEVKWSNGSVMPIGVCRDCASNHKYDTPEAKRGITEAHWKYWEAQGAKPDKAVVIV